MLNPDLNQPPAPSTLVPALAASGCARVGRDAALAVMVVFAIRNRAGSLVQVLECLTRLIAPADGWKLMIFDNGSTDDTALPLHAQAGRLLLVALSEPNTGKNRALNAALPHLEGGLIILTDDDALPQPDRLVRLRQAAVDHPEASSAAPCCRTGAARRRFG